MKKAILFTFFLSSIAGCAFTIHDVNVNYEYSTPVNVNLAHTPNKLKIDSIGDGRGFDKARLVVFLPGGPGGYQAEKPMADIIRDGIVQGLTKAQVPIVDKGENLELSGVLVSYGAQVRPGFFKASADYGLSVFLSLKETSTHREVWHGTFVGIASSDADEEGVREALKTSLNQVVSNLLNDQLFIRLLTVPWPSPNSPGQSAEAKAHFDLMRKLCPNGIVNNSACIENGVVSILPPGAKELIPARPGWQPTDGGPWVCFQDCERGMPPLPTPSPANTVNPSRSTPI